MSIERAIYASLPIGIENSVNGFQFFSYTRDFIKLLDEDTTGRLKGMARAGYRSVCDFEWQSDAPLNVDLSAKNISDYRITVCDSDEERNRAELRSTYFSPYSFSYSTVTVGGNEKALFIFGKNMGYDWTGNRPGNNYIYSVICDTSDVCRAPVFYCSSPAVVCNIPRSEFFHNDGTCAEKPGLLSNPLTLEQTTDISPLKTIGVFGRITESDIQDFLDQGSNTEVFLSMVDALLKLKDGDVGKRLIISDKKENALMWIAALTNTFPLELAKNISFSSYTFSPSDYDINCVFDPSYNGCFSSSLSGYDYNSVRNAYAVFDFKQGSFYSGKDDDMNGLFRAMLESICSSGFSVINQYKEFIINDTTLRNSGSDYAKGIDLFAYMKGLRKFDLSQAVEFAMEYASVHEKKALLDRMLNEKNIFISEPNMIPVLKEYIKHCVCIGEISDQAVRDSYMKQFTDGFFGSVNMQELFDLIKICSEVCGIKYDTFYELFVQSVQSNKLVEFAKNTNDRWKLLFINRAVMISANKTRSRITPSSASGMIISLTIDRLIFSDNMQEAAQMEDYIRSNLSMLGSLESQYGMCECVLKAVYDKSFKNCVNSVISVLADMYMNGDEKSSKWCIASMKMTPYYDMVIDMILQKIKKENNMLRLIGALNDLSLYTGNSLGEKNDSIKAFVMNSLKKSISNDPTENINMAYEVFKFLMRTDKERIKAEDLEYVLKQCIDGALALYPDMVIESKALDEINEINKHVEYLGDHTYSLLVSMLNSLARIYMDIGLHKPNTCFNIKDRAPYELIDISDVSQQISNQYLDAIGNLCGIHWAKTGVMPVYSKMYIADRRIADLADERVFNRMFRVALNKTRNNSRMAADIIIYSISCDYKTVIDKMETWLSECGVKRNVADILQKDYEKKVTLKKGANEGVIDNVSPAELKAVIDRLQNYKKSDNGLFGGLMSIFKHK